MTNVKFLKSDFEKHIKLTPEIIEKISLFGTPLESINDKEIEIEVFPNRPDLISLQGFVRSFKAFIGKEKGLKEYSIAKPLENYKVDISPNLKNIRPFTACAIVKNLDFDDKKIKEIIELQEKLHITIGRNRKKVAIGIYPLDKIKLPIKYLALEPSKIKFTPLESDGELTANQILSKHPTGKEFAHLLEGFDKFPIFTDSLGNILSMPPIINSHTTGKISQNTKEVFIECSGSNLETLQKTLNIIVTTLAEMGGKIFQMHLDYGGKKIITPDLTPQKIKISLENVNKLLGLDLKEKDLDRLLPLMGYEYNNNTVIIPSWRTDIMHEVDIIEDIAIAYGYNNLSPEIPNISTIGEESKIEKIKLKISDLLIGLEINEISTYHLIKKAEAELSDLKEKIEVENSKTDFKILRSDLLTPALRTFSENKDHDYPQKIFEIGTIFLNDKNNISETGIIEKDNLLIALSPSNFTEIKQILNYLELSLNISIEIKEIDHKDLINGRSASLLFNKKQIGYFGEVHPKTLQDWNIKMPLSVLEISLNEIMDNINI